MINTQPLKDAASAAKMKEERIICRELASSISDGSPYAWKMFYSGKASSVLSSKSFKALEELIKTAEKVFNTPSCKSPKPKPKTKVSVERSKGKGIKIGEPNTEHDKAKIMATPITRPPIVCGLRALGFNENSAPKRKGNEKVVEMKMKVDSGLDEKQGLPWEGMSIREANFAEEGNYHDMFCEDDDGKLRLFKVYEDYEEDFDDDGPEIPLSPCREGEELDPNHHAFLLLRKFKGTLKSS